MNMGHIILACVLAWALVVWGILVWIPCDERNYSFSDKIECAYDRHVDLVRDILFD